MTNSLIRQVVEAKVDDKPPEKKAPPEADVARKRTMSREDEAKAGREGAGKIRGKLEKTNLVSRVAAHGENKHQVVIQFAGPTLNLNKVRAELNAMKQAGKISFNTTQ